MSECAKRQRWHGGGGQLIGRTFLSCERSRNLWVENIFQSLMWESQKKDATTTRTQWDKKDIFYEVVFLHIFSKWQTEMWLQSSPLYFSTPVNVNFPSVDYYES